MMANVNNEILAVLNHNFKLGLKAAETILRNQEKQENKTLSDCPAPNTEVNDHQ